MKMKIPLWITRLERWGVYDVVCMVWVWLRVCLRMSMSMGIDIDMDDRYGCRCRALWQEYMCIRTM